LSLSGEVDVTTTERDYRRRLVRRARRANISLVSETADRLASYLELLAVWNRRINLTALDDPDAAVDRLILEPLLAARHVPVGSRVIDIGSGGGSPAIPLKIAVGNIALTMIESKVRKGAFLREAVRTLGLDKVVVEVRRYEELLANPAMHESTDVVTVRAVRVEASVLVSLQAFLRVGGQVLWFRGPGQTDLDRLPFPLVAESDEPLVESLRSRLVRLRRLPLDISQPLARV
jgi:16S rRNA (guanine527-N7)-methyltransferase